MKEPNSLGDPGFLKDLPVVNDSVSTSTIRQLQSESPVSSDVAPVADMLDPAREAQSLRLTRELELACLATRATGAAIALVRGDEIVCQATTGPQAPDVGVYLDPRKGLSGACIQTRLLQQCVDTQTDPRVDPEACRRLGVRSIVVLPLIDGDELFGILEILSSLPNAFGPADFDTLQALTSRLVATRKQGRQAPATVASSEVRSYVVSADHGIARDKSLPAAPEPGLPLGERTSRKNDMWTPVLGALVIGAALFLGMLIGWRLGWERATHRLRHSAASSRVNGSSRREATDPTGLPSKELQQSSGSREECGPSAAAGLPQASSGGLTICQAGKVIFRWQPPPALPIQTSRTSQPSPALRPGSGRR